LVGQRGGGLVGQGGGGLVGIGGGGLVHVGGGGALVPPGGGPPGRGRGVMARTVAQSNPPSASSNANLLMFLI
jgi:hypothetical protein